MFSNMNEVGDKATSCVSWYGSPKLLACLRNDTDDMMQRSCNRTLHKATKLHRVKSDRYSKTEPHSLAFRQWKQRSSQSQQRS